MDEFDFQADQLMDGDSDLLDSLEEDTDNIEEEDGIWEDLDACSLGNAVLFEIENGAEPNQAVELALQHLEEDPSYFLQPDFADYEELQDKTFTSDMVPEGVTPEMFEGEEGAETEYQDIPQRAASIENPLTASQIDHIVSLLDSRVSKISKTAFMGPGGYLNYYGDPYESDFFDRSPDLYPDKNTQNPGFNSLRHRPDSEDDDWFDASEALLKSS